MFIVQLLFVPISIFLCGIIIRDYDYKYYDTHPKYLSKNGINLSFIKLSEEQWEFFLKKLSIKYHSILAICSFIFNIIINILFRKNNDTIWFQFTFFFIGEFLIFILMYKNTRKKIK